MRRAAVLLLFLVPACLCGGEGAPDHNTFTVAPDDPVLKPDIDRCFTADGLCEQLCRDLLAVPPDGDVLDIRECYVNVLDDGDLEVHATSVIVTACF